MILVVLVGAFIIYSIYIHFEYKRSIHQGQNHNAYYLSIISVHGKNLADRLEEFVDHSLIEDEAISEDVKEHLYNNWRIVNGESKSIYSFLGQFSTLHVKDDEASDWSLLRYSLLRIDGFIDSMTNKFLKQHSYAVNNEEKEKMEAVISIYRTIYEETEKEDVNLKNILQSIKEPMLIIDDLYLNTLEHLQQL